MSLEQALLIVFLVVLPLIQYLMQHVRRRTAPPRQAKDAPSSANRPPLREQHPALSQVAEALTNRTVRRAEQQPTATMRRGNRFDLRRAIVFMTLIGPCRATRPYDLPDSG